LFDPNQLAAVLPRKGVYATGRARSSLVSGTPCEPDTLQRETAGVSRGDDPLRRLQGREGKPLSTSLQALHSGPRFQNLSVGFTGPVPVRPAQRRDAMLRLVPQETSDCASEAASSNVDRPQAGGIPLQQTPRRRHLRLVCSEGRRVRQCEVPEVLVTACGLLKEILRKAERDLAAAERE
jgi:hypothetical protein